jgi:hypothetical protein
MRMESNHARGIFQQLRLCPPARLDLQTLFPLSSDRRHQGKARGTLRRSPSLLFIVNGVISAGS